MCNMDGSVQEYISHIVPSCTSAAQPGIGILYCDCQTRIVPHMLCLFIMCHVCSYKSRTSSHASIIVHLAIANNQRVPTFFALTISCHGNQQYSNCKKTHVPMLFLGTCVKDSTFNIYVGAQMFPVIPLYGSLCSCVIANTNKMTSFQCQ